MKAKYIKYIILLIIMQNALSIQSQDYEQVIKGKLGEYWGVTYKYLTDFESGYELLYHQNKNGLNFTALRVFQQPAFPERSSKWFFCYGFGTHVSLYHKYSIYNPFKPFDPPRKHNKEFVSIGFDGYAGLEYRFLKHPFVLSIDFIPNFEFLGPDYFRVNTNNMCVGIAYIIK